MPNEEQKLIRLADLTLNEYEQNKKFVTEWSKENAEKGPARIVWFIPQIKNILAGGVRTIFSIAETFSEKFGTSHYFVIDDFKEKFNLTPEGIALHLDIQKHFPKLKLISLIHHTRKGSIADTIPDADFGVATLWPTAYLLAKYNQCKKKVYLVQDDESLFYPAGTMSSIINETYQLGFHCVCNTHEVAEVLSEKFGDLGFSGFSPGVDKSIFYPLKRTELKPPYQIVFYGRTKNTRNCFVLAAEILSKVKEQLKDEVTIISVGEDWSKEFPEYVEKGIKCLGRLDSMEAVAKLYGESHLGLCFMATPHSSYQPLEYMVSGCVPIHLEKSYPISMCAGLHVPANIEVAADRIVTFLRDKKEYLRIREAGLDSVIDYSWNSGIDWAVEEVNKECSI